VTSLPVVTSLSSSDDVPNVKAVKTANNWKLQRAKKCQQTIRKSGRDFIENIFSARGASVAAEQVLRKIDSKTVRD
jgi:hypothetical protein